MSATKTKHADSLFTELLLRAFALLAYAYAVSRFGLAWWEDRTRWTLLLLVIIEGFTGLMVLLARRAERRDFSPLVVVATVYAGFFYLLFQTAGTTRLIPELAGVGLQVAGMLWQFAAKIALGRSFGLLPAARGLVVSGPYRVVRHPIYLGYLVTHVGFLLTNFCWRNLLILVMLYMVQVLRIFREEAQLGLSEAYQEYRRRVRWRLLPFVF